MKSMSMEQFKVFCMTQGVTFITGKAPSKKRLMKMVEYNLSRTCAACGIMLGWDAEPWSHASRSEARAINAFLCRAEDIADVLEIALTCKAFKVAADCGADDQRFVLIVYSGDGSPVATIRALTARNDGRNDERRDALLGDALDTAMRFGYISDRRIERYKKALDR